jgi:hypothetical protein
MEKVRDLDAALARADASPAPGLDRRALEQALQTTLAALDREGAPKRARSWRGRAPKGKPAGSQRARPMATTGASRAARQAAATDAPAERASGAYAAETAPTSSGAIWPQAVDERLGHRRAIEWLIVSALGVAVGLGTAIVAKRGERSLAVSGVAASVPASRPLDLTDDERSALDAAVSLAEDLDRTAAAGVAFRAYFNRVSSAHAEASRHLDDVKAGELKQLVGQALLLHRLAASAWRARTLNETEAWERIGGDPAAELCAPVRRVLDSGDDPPRMSRGQWRGLAIAATIPLVWDCAAERVSRVRRMLGAR